MGRNVPDLRFHDGTRLSGLLRDGHGIAVDLSPGRRLRGATDGREDLVRYVAGPAKNDLGCGALLVRPDGVVAWADGPDPDREAFERAADRWFGRGAGGGSRAEARST